MNDAEKTDRLADRSAGREPDGWYVSSGPPQALGWLAEAFTANLAAAGSSLLGSDLAVRLSGSVRARRKQFAAAMEEPTCCYGLAWRPAGANGASAATDLWLEFSPPIALAMIERLLGGAPGPLPMDARPLTAIERRVLHRLAQAAAVSLSAAWPTDVPDRQAGAGGEQAPAGAGGQCRTPPARYLRAEMAPLALDAAGDEPAVAFAFELTLGTVIGTLRLCVPAEAVPQPLPASSPRRRAAMPLELTAALEAVPIEGEELADLQPGDIVATDVPADGEVIVRIGGIPKFAARLGAAGGNKALTILRRLDGPRSR